MIIKVNVFNITAGVAQGDPVNLMIVKVYGSECSFDWIAPPTLDRDNSIQTQLSSDPFGRVDSIRSKKHSQCIYMTAVVTL